MQCYGKYQSVCSVLLPQQCSATIMYRASYHHGNTVRALTSSPWTGLHSAAVSRLQIFSFHGNICFSSCCWFLFQLCRVLGPRARGDDVVKKMPGENGNKDLAHNFLHKEFSQRVTRVWLQHVGPAASTH